MKREKKAAKPKILKSTKASRGNRPNTCLQCGGNDFC